MSVTPEGKIVQSIVNYLKARKRQGDRVWWLKTHGGPMQRSGIPDLHIILNGRAYWVEVKVPGKRPTRLQEHTLQEIGEAGGCPLGYIYAAWVDSLEDLKKLLGEPYETKRSANT